jgi:hypothetical protein
LKNWKLVFALASLVLVFPAAATTPAQAVEAYAKLPLSFEANRGQVAADVAYLSRGRDYTLFLTGSEAVLALSRHDARSAILRMRLVGAKPRPQIDGESLLPGTMNYLFGSDASRWHTAIPTYRQVRYGSVWPGVDLVWHGTRRALEYDFVLQPGADPEHIRLSFEGSERPRLDRDGNLILKTPAGDLIQHAPVIYQDGDDGRTPVAGRYVLKGKRQVGFEIARYDASRPLVIDPVLSYSTYLGSSSVDEAFAIAVSNRGEAFITGSTNTFTLDFPQLGALDTSTGDTAVFVTKLNTKGTDVVYSSLIGSSSNSDLDCFDGFCDVVAKGIAITADGKACITGGAFNSREHSTYPVTDNAFQRSDLGCTVDCDARFTLNTDAFVTVLSTNGGKIEFSTFYGGSSAAGGEGLEVGEAIAVDREERIYITGRTTSDDLPTRNGFQAARGSTSVKTDAFVAVFDPSRTKGDDTLLYASYLGGTENDTGLGIAVDDAHSAYVGGGTRSKNLPSRSPRTQSLPPLQDRFQGGLSDGFVARIDTASRNLSSLIYLTYLGGSESDRVEGIAVDASQNAYVTGGTSSAANSFPLANAFDTTQNNREAFVAELNADGTTLVYSSFLGGDNGTAPADVEEGRAIALDGQGSAYVTGHTTAGDTFPVGDEAPPFAAKLRGTAFVAKVNSAAKLIYSTTFGGDGTFGEGIAVDRNGSAYLAGTSTGALPTTGGAFQPDFSGGTRDAFVAKVSSSANDTTGLYDLARHEFLLRNTNTTGGPDATVLLGQHGDFPVAGDWDADGISDIGVFRPVIGKFVLRLGESSGFQVVTVQFVGEPGDQPVIGDWDGDGFDTVGVYRTNPAGPAVFFLTNEHADVPFAKVERQEFLGQPGDLPIGGDWDGDGIDTVGLYRTSSSVFFLINDFAAGIAAAFDFGVGGDLPLAGDWNGDGRDGVGVYRPSNKTMHQTEDLNATERVFTFISAGDRPVGGNWVGP